MKQYDNTITVGDCGVKIDPNVIIRKGQHEELAEASTPSDQTQEEFLQ